MPSQLLTFSMTPFGVSLFDVAGSPLVDPAKAAKTLLDVTPTMHGSVEVRGGARAFRDCILDFGVASLVTSIRSLYAGKLRGRRAEFIVFTADTAAFSGHVVVGNGWTAVTPARLSGDEVNYYGRPGARAAYSVYNDTLYIVQQGSTTLAFRPAYRNDIRWQASPNIPSALCASTHGDRLWIGGLDGREDAVAFSAVGAAGDFAYERGDAGILSISRRGGDVVTALSPTFYGDIYAFTADSISRISAPSVSQLQRESVSDSLGCASHAGVVQVGNDLFFPSARGVHSLLTTQKFGDVETEFLSAPIQRLWNRIDPADLERSSACYDPQRGLYLLAVPDRHMAFGGTHTTKVLVLHVQTRRWSVWDVAAECVALSGLQGWARMPIAASGTKLYWLNCPDRFDTDALMRGADWSPLAAARKTYTPKVVTHWIDCGSPDSNKNFRRLDLHFRSGASYIGRVHWLIDDQYSLPLDIGSTRQRFSADFNLNPRGDNVMGEGSAAGSDWSGPPYIFLGEMDDTPLHVSVPLTGSGKRIQIEVEMPSQLNEDTYSGGYEFELLGMDLSYLVEGQDWQTVGINTPSEQTQTVWMPPAPAGVPVTVGVGDGPETP